MTGEITGKMPRKHFRFLKKKSRFLPQVPNVSTRSYSRPAARFYPRRRAYDDDVLYVPFRHAPFHHAYDTTGNENFTRSQVNRELIMSSAAMDDNYDLSNRSRQRDRDILTAANRAISPSVTATSGLDTMSRGVSEIRRTGSLRRFKPRSASVPPKRPTSLNTTSIIPLDLAASPSPRPSPYLKYSNTLNNVQSLRDGTYKPLYSQTVRTPVSPARELFSLSRDNSPFRDVTPYRSESPFSPTSSGIQTPVEHWYPVGSQRVGRKRHKPRVLSTKRKVGNYYNRLLNRRSVEPGAKIGKYWPYLDVNDIENTSVGDLFSDTDSITGDSGTKYLVQGGNAESYSDYGGYDNSPVTYVYDSDSDIPSDYVPFRPRVKYRSPERDYSELSIIPYIPKRDPTNTVADDIAFNALVAASAARARQALERINFDEYDSASMVLSVEGEYHPPMGDVPVGFKYVSRPLALKRPASAIVSAYDSDDVFTKYMTDLQKFREGIRERLQEGYRALSDTTKSYYTPALPSSSYQPYTSSRPSLDLKPYRKRLGANTEYKYGQSLELYPLESSSQETMRSRSRQRKSEEVYPESRAIQLYDSQKEPDSRLSTLSKIQIKVATELHSSPRAAVAARRATRGHSTPPAPIQTSANYSKTEAALLGSKVEVNLPHRRRPKSAYAQAKVRQMRLDSSSRDASPVGASAAYAAETAGLKAHKPVYVPTLVKPIQGVDGPKPSLMSWQYRIDAYTPPEDLILVPRSLTTMKAQVRDAQDKLDRHRQLMDRYLVTDTGMSVDDMRVLMNMKSRNPHAEPALTAPITADSYKSPMSPVRRKARRVLATTKGDPEYFSLTRSSRRTERKGDD